MLARLRLKNLWQEFRKKEDVYLEWPDDENLDRSYINTDQSAMSAITNNQAYNTYYGRVVAITELIKKASDNKYRYGIEGYMQNDFSCLASIVVDSQYADSCTLPKLVIYQPSYYEASMLSDLSSGFSFNYQESESTTGTMQGGNKVKVPCYTNTGLSNRDFIIGMVDKNYDSQDDHADVQDIWTDSNGIAQNNTDIFGTYFDGLFNHYYGLKLGLKHSRTFAKREGIDFNYNFNNNYSSKEKYLTGKMKIFSQMAFDDHDNVTKDDITCVTYEDRTNNESGVTLLFRQDENTVDHGNDFRGCSGFILVFGHKDGHDYALGLRTAKVLHSGTEYVLSEFTTDDVIFSYVDGTQAMFVNPSVYNYNYENPMEDDKYYSSHPRLVTSDSIELEVDSPIFRPIYTTNKNEPSLSTWAPQTICNGKYTLIAPNVAIDTSVANIY